MSKTLLKNNMKYENLAIRDVILIKPDVYEDPRGYFFESFNSKKFNELVGYDVSFVQDNHSFSKKGVLRGIHFQKNPHAQGKLVRVVTGEVFDVAVDLRKNSSTYGSWVGAHLSAKNNHQLWVPAGFGHAFLTLSDDVSFLYKTTNYYNKSSEESIIWNDKKINIDWPLNVIKNPYISEKDDLAKTFEESSESHF